MKPYLLVRPKPFLDESALGYMLRVAELNGVSSLATLGRLYKDEQSKFYLWNQVFSRLGLRDSEIKCIFGPLPKDRLVRNTLKGLSLAEFNHHHIRWCPHCLKEEAYLRSIWGLKLTTVCVRHGCQLLESCVQCGHKQSWQYGNILNCIHCGILLCKALTQSSSSMSISIHQSILASLAGKIQGTFIKLDTVAWLRLLRYMGQFKDGMLPQRPGQALGLHQLSVANLYIQNTANLLEQWPSKFEQLLQSIHTLQPNVTSIKKCFGVLYHVLYVHLNDNQYQFLRDAFEQYLHNHWSGTICQRNRLLKSSTIEQHPQLTIKHVTKRTEVSASLIRKLAAIDLIQHHQFQLPSGRQSESIHLAHLPYIEALAQDVMDLQTTAKYLGISERLVRELVSAKIIKPLVIRGHLKAATWLISKQAHKHFMLTPIIDADVTVVTMATLIKSWRLNNTELMSLIKAIISKELTPYDSTGQSVGLGRVKLDKLAIRSWLYSFRKKFSDTLSVNETAIALGLKQQVAYHLVNYGLIASNQTQYEGKRINKKTINGFKKRYVSLAELACIQNTSSSALLKTLNIKPVTGPQVDGGRQYFYLRKQVKMLKSAHA